MNTMRTVRTVMRVLPAVLAVAAAGCERSAAVRDAEDRGDPALRQARAKRAMTPAEAIADYRQILDSNPRMGTAHLDLALLLHDEAKDYVGAIYHYRRYMELRPESQKASMIAARIQDATRRFARQAQGAESAATGVVVGLSVDAARVVEENASLKIEVARLTQELESARGARQDDASAPERPREAGAFREQMRERPVVTAEQARVAAPVRAPAVAPAKARSHKVRPKETLLSIAETVYGDRGQWKRILDANSGQLRGDPKRLREGMELTIP